jgi:hypothetical protein
MDLFLNYFQECLSKLQCKQDFVSATSLKYAQLINDNFVLKES